MYPPALPPSSPTVNIPTPRSGTFVQSISLYWHITITQSPRFSNPGSPLGFVQALRFDKCIMTCIHHYSEIWYFHYPQDPLCSADSALPPTPTLSSPVTDLLLSPWFFASSEYQTVRDCTICSLSDWLLSLVTIMKHLRSVHVFSWLDSSFHSNTEKYSIV